MHKLCRPRPVGGRWTARGPEPGTAPGFRGADEMATAAAAPASPVLPLPGRVRKGTVPPGRAPAGPIRTPARAPTRCVSSAQTWPNPPTRPAGRSASLLDPANNLLPSDPGACGESDETAETADRWYAACKIRSAPGHGAPATHIEETMR
jgi:hypothetical protein